VSVLLIGSDGNHIKAGDRVKPVNGTRGRRAYAQLVPVKVSNATTLPSVSSPRDPAPSKAFPLESLRGNGHIANVNGSHGQVKRERERMVDSHGRAAAPRVFELRSWLRSDRRSFPTTTPPDVNEDRTSPLPTTTGVWVQLRAYSTTARMSRAKREDFVLLSIYVSWAMHALPGDTSQFWKETHSPGIGEVRRIDIRVQS